MTLVWATTVDDVTARRALEMIVAMVERLERELNLGCIWVCIYCSKVAKRIIKNVAAKDGSYRLKRLKFHFGLNFLIIFAGDHEICR